MVVIFEFLGNEPIENIITCMHFKVDKVVFFGYQETIENQKDRCVSFLEKYCGVSKVVFQPMSHSNLKSILETMRKEIKLELDQKNNIYFDITGGESLILVAFGMLSKEFDTPMHLFNVIDNKLIELDEGAENSISRDVEKHDVKLDIDRFVEMWGGTVNYNLHKEIKGDLDGSFASDVRSLWTILKKHGDYWNNFCTFIRSHMVPDDNLRVCEDIAEIKKLLDESACNFSSEDKLNKILNDLSEEGLIKNLSRKKNKYSYTIKSQEVKDCLWDTGSSLELIVYLDEKEKSDECMVGVHLDWDGVIHYQAGVDVLNEIDVFSLTGLVPTFISCKVGKMESQKILHALYELDTVAKRFGGKYAKKVLVTNKTINDVYIKRAEEMGIEIRSML